MTETEAVVVALRQVHSWDGSFIVADAQLSDEEIHSLAERAITALDNHRIERAGDVDDHDRGCEGRTYTCTCGYDDRTDATIAALKAQIERLTERDGGGGA
jgi:hypothetical protein